MTVFSTCISSLNPLFRSVYAQSACESAVMTSNILENADPQSASPLFNRIPAEIRNEVFEHALTAYDDKTKPYQNGSYCYRPGHRYAHKVDTNLLLTCRRIYAETKDIPASINPYTCWFERAPPHAGKQGLTRLSTENTAAVTVRHRGLKYVHIHTQQFWLCGSTFGHFTRLWKLASPTHLKLTIRHSDWYWWENEEEIALDPKKSGIPSGYSNASDTFAPMSWGSELQKMEGLKVFQLELETVEMKKDELDAIVARAPGWQFPLHGDQIMVLDERKTQRTGWLGHRLARHAKISEKHPFAAKERLVKGGVIFEDMELDPDIAEDQYLCYYVVTLTWNARAIQLNA
ncbi:hypothetical protein N7G274_001054 [Stereocaulon virgatum]|uniref:Uncharacterized protein n=1 Tax=Stereocaulon virgatum TaxID=373712 RepID=A0ABR4AND9_9LECA